MRTARLGLCLLLFLVAFESTAETKEDRKVAKALCESDIGTTDNKGLDNFSATYGTGTALVKTDLGKAYAPIWQDEIKKEAASKGDKFEQPWFHHPHSLGFTATAALPASAATLMDYANNELLLRDGAFAALFLSIGPDAVSAKSRRGCQDKKQEKRAFSRRPFVANRIYLYTHGQALPEDEGLVYFTHGIGAKALKTTLVGNNSFAAAGAAYMGFGFDAPLYDPDGRVDLEHNDPTGLFDVQVFGAYNAVNANSINKMYSTTGAPTGFASYGVSMRFYLTGSVRASVDYAAPIGSRIRSAGVREVTVFSLSYSPTTESSKKAGTAATAGEHKNPPKDSDESVNVVPPETPSPTDRP